jgi:hypothetical protein
VLPVLAYVGRPETDWARGAAMGMLAGGLFHAKQYEGALTVQKVELSTLHSIGASEEDVLVMKSNLAATCDKLGRREPALQVKREVYDGYLKLKGQVHPQTHMAANNYAGSLVDVERFEEARSLMRRQIPVAQRVLGENHEFTLTMRSIYAQTLYNDPGATLDDLREAVTTLEDVARIARRVLGGAHPHTSAMEQALRNARAALGARDTPPPSGSV